MDVDVVQFSFDLLDPSVDGAVATRIVEETLDECRRHGIRLHSCFTGLAAYSFNLLLHPDPGMRRWARKWYGRALEIASGLGVGAVGGHLGSISSGDNADPRRREHLIAQLMDEVETLSVRARSLGLECLLWEPMPTSREPPSSVEETETLLSRVNRRTRVPVKLCLDVGHTCNPASRSSRDADPYHWLMELGKESPCVHIQQTDGVADRHWPFTPKFNRVGKILPERVLAALDASGAKEVTLFLEAVPSFEQPDVHVVRDIRTSMRYWKQFM